LAVKPGAIFIQLTVPGTRDQVFEFALEIVNIGRAPDNDLVLAHGSVAEHHARVLLRDERFIVTDLRTQEGTYLGGRRLAQAVIIQPGDVLNIGAYALAIMDRPPSATDEQFLAAIAAAPRDDDTRVVYSDWLDENGRHDEAAFIRAQLAIKPLAPETPEFQELSTRIRVLAANMAPEWRRVVAHAPLENCGFRYEVKCPKRWESLAPSASPSTRFCDGCQRDVHYARTIGEARQLAQAGECLVVDLGQRREPGDLVTRPAPSYDRVPNPGMFAPPPGYVPPRRDS